MIDPQVVREMGLNEREYRQVLDTLGREPTPTELGMFAVMWSEHCGYKYSRPILARFKNYKEALEQGALENAGVVPLDDKLGICFKIESHNHPSAVEPFQGAATGVGGILRDIFTMGARPIANLNSLRFGPLDDPRNRYLFEHVVAGISHYGNCLSASERFVWRDAQGVHFDTIGNFVEQRLAAHERMRELDHEAYIETLSLDVETLQSVWKRVRRVFRRETSQLIRLGTALGRTLDVTPDHPMLIREEGTWRTKLAGNIERGDEIPLLVHMPTTQHPSQLRFDLIELLRQSSEELDTIFVSLPETWQITDCVREELRRFVPSAVRRHSYISKHRFPLACFLQLEPLLNISRDEVCLFRVGKANHMRAVINVDAAFARLIGYYLAEGCVSRNGNTYKIIFTFARHEQASVDDVVNSLSALGLRPCVEQRSSTIAVYATSWLLGWMLKDLWQCGEGAENKAFPSILFTWPQHLQREALKGLLRGDGSLSTRTHGNQAKITFATASSRLFHQTLALVQNEGAIPYIYERPAQLTSIQGRQYHRCALWQLEISNIAGLTALSDVFDEQRNAQLAQALARYNGSKYSYPRHIREEGVATVRIQDVTPLEPTPCVVYDVEVDDTHLFATTSGIVTHNCVGVPTVAGEIYFHPCYSGNPLVNAMAVGVVDRDKIASAAAKGVGNPVIYVGSATGKDGIHGATFASVELGPDSESKRPNVQMGDPFMEKLLIEATLEALATGLVVGIQDMGAAGLTCSTCETAAKAGTGMEIDVRKVPLREADMTPYEIMLSESQERMLCIAQRGTEQQVMDVFQKWGLNAAVVGHVTDDGLVRVFDNGEVVAEVPAQALTNECPTYHLETEEPDYIKEVQAFEFSTLPEPNPPFPFPGNESEKGGTVTVAGQEDLSVALTALDVSSPPSLARDERKGKGDGGLGSYTDCLLQLLDAPNIASKGYVTEQYDSMVQTQTVAMPGSDAAVLRVRGSQKGIAVKIDGNGRYGYLDPYVGGQLAVVEAARNVACVGARPAAVTDNLNFANPEKPTGFWQFQRSVEGIATATEAFGTPVVSGNVSFYNETPEYGPIFPTPTIGMLGILDDVNKRTQAAFREDGEGDTIVLLTAYDDSTGGLGGSEYLSVIHGVEAGVPPRVDLEGEKRLHALLLESIGEGLFANCHDLSDGGLAVCLAECCTLSRQGALILLNPSDFPGDLPLSATLFGEAQGRVVVSVRTEKQFAKLKARAEQLGIRAAWIGTVGGENLRIAQGPHDVIDLPVSLLAETSQSAIPRRMGILTVPADN